MTGWDLQIGLADENEVLIVFDTGMVVFSTPSPSQGIFRSSGIADRWESRQFRCPWVCSADQTHLPRPSHAKLKSPQNNF